MANIAFKTAFVPSSTEQLQMLERAFGTARFAYNWALSTWEINRSQQCPNSFISLRNALNKEKKTEFPWMADVPKDIPAEAIRDLTRSFKNFFDKNLKAGYPKRKKKFKSKFSFRLPADRLRFRDEQRVGGGVVTSVYLSTLGWVTLRERFERKGRLLSVTVSRHAERYFISFCMEYLPIKRAKQLTKPLSVGIDLGLTHTVVLSSGVKIEGPRSYRTDAEKLADANRKLHRKIKGSANRAKAAGKVARIHQRIANVRRDFVEKTTTQLLRTYDIIGIEDLNVAGMMKSGRAAKSTADAGLGSFTSALHRKETKYGCLVVEVDRFFPSSKQCRKCKVKKHDLTLADRLFQCSSDDCGHYEDRDIHAAKNIHLESLQKIPGANGKCTPVEIWSLPAAPQGVAGKPGRRRRKWTPRGATMSNTGWRQNTRWPEQVTDQVCQCHL